MKNKSSVAFLLLLALPLSAGIHFCLTKKPDLLLILIAGIYLLAISVLAFFCMKADKRKAENGHWRIPEANLHLLEFLGGWPGSFLGQRVYRHKISKLKYQCTFYFICLLHSALAVDYFMNWYCLKSLIEKF